MKIGYIRVSTKDQNTDRQEKLLKELGVEKIFSEKISGKNTERPQLKAMMEFAREGDILYVESYSRLARSTQDLLTIIASLNSKGVQFVSLKENVDTTSPQGRLMLTIFAGLAQFERECILQRQAEGIAIAKEKGKYKGRKPISKPENWNEVIEKWNRNEITAVQAQKELGFKSNTFYRRVKDLFPVEKSIRITAE